MRVQRGDVMQVMEQGKIERLLTRPFDMDVLKNKTKMGLYIENPFRLVSLSGKASRQDTESAVSNFNNRYRLLGDKMIHKNACKLGYCKNGIVKDPKAILGQLEHPLKRIFNEVFWFNLSQEIVDLIKSGDSIGDREVRNIIRQAFKNNGNENKALYRHAVAISYHNAAIDNEIDYLLGSAPLDPGLWERSFKNWAETLNDENFWRHFEERIRQINDFRLTIQDVEELKEKIPGIILSFNSIFADVYGNMSRNEDLNRHIKMLTESGFAKNTSREMLKNIARLRIDEEIRPMVAMVQDQILNEKSKLSYENFKNRLDKVFDVISNIFEPWRKLQYPEEMLCSPVTDKLAELILKATNEKLDYKGDAQKINLIYNLLIFEKLLEIPLASSTRLKLNQEARKVRGILYPDHAHLPETILPTKCWFISTEPADPVSGIKLKFYMIDKIHGANVSWNKHEVMIPRSKLAKDYHDGKISKKNIQDKLQEKFADEQAKLIDLKEQVEKITSEIRNAFEEQKGSVRQQSAIELAEFTETYARKKGVPLEEIDKLDTYRKKETDKVEKERKVALSRIDDEFNDTLLGRKKKLGKSPSKIARFSSDISVGLMFLGISSLYYYHQTGNFFIAGDSIRIIISMTIVALVVADILFVGITAILKSYRKFAFNRINKKVESKKLEVNQAFDDQLKGVDEILVNKFPQLIDTIQAIKKKRMEIEKAKNLNFIQIQKHEDEEIASKTNPLKAKIDEIEKRIRIDVKEESYREQFPSLQNIKKKGYKPGEKPPQHEMDAIVKRELERFMNSLTAHERQILSLKAQVMSNSNFNQYVANLMANNQRPSF